MFITGIGKILRGNKAAHGSDLAPFSSKEVGQLVDNRIDNIWRALNGQIFCGVEVVGFSRIVVSVEQNGFVSLLLSNPSILGEARWKLSN